MKMGYREEESKCFSGISRNLAKLLLAASVTGLGAYTVSNSVFYVNKENDAIIVNLLTGQKSLIENEGFYAHWPFIEYHVITKNIVDVDNIKHLLENIVENKLSKALQKEYKTHLPSLDTLMKVYGVDSKEKLYEGILTSLIIYNKYGEPDEKLYKSSMLYLNNILADNNKLDLTFDKYFPIINNHHNNNYSLEFDFISYGGRSGATDIVNNTIKLSYQHVLSSFLFSLVYTDQDLREIIFPGVSENELKIQTIFAESVLFTALTHEKIHAQGITDESIVEALTFKILADNLKLDENFETYLYINAYNRLSEILSWAGYEVNNNLPAQKTFTETVKQYSLGTYKLIMSSLLTDGKLFVPENKSLIDISNLSDLFNPKKQ
jgi:hypothetical protein